MKALPVPTRSQQGSRASWTPAMEQFLKDNWKTKTTQEIADQLGITYRQVESKAYTRGLTRTAKPTMATHPLPVMSDPEWAYLAGLIDGEGTITIVQKMTKGKQYPQPKLHVTNTCPLMRDWLVARGFQSALRVNSKNTWYFTMVIPQIHLQHVLEKLLPWLVTKRHLAMQVLRWIELRNQLPFRYTPTPEMVSIHKAIYTWNTTGSEKYGNALLKKSST